jgi:starvation-inducible outer membrane lipoprotein
MPRARNSGSMILSGSVIPEARPTSHSLRNGRMIATLSGGRLIPLPVTSIPAETEA